MIIKLMVTDATTATNNMTPMSISLLVLGGIPPLLGRLAPSFIGEGFLLS
jgi:hypothetical protein